MSRGRIGVREEGYYFDEAAFFSSFTRELSLNQRYAPEPTKRKARMCFTIRAEI
jgi:hypothetical protein